MRKRLKYALGSLAMLAAMPGCSAPKVAQLASEAPANDPVSVAPTEASVTLAQVYPAGRCEVEPMIVGAGQPRLSLAVSKKDTGAWPPFGFSRVPLMAQPPPEPIFLLPRLEKIPRPPGL